MDLNNFNPHPKNPNIRKFFMAMGWADEIGSGIRNTRKYLPHYVENAVPVFIDEPLFRIIIPLARHTMVDFKYKWLKWLELDEKWQPKLEDSLKNIEIDGQLHKMSWEELIPYLVSGWIEEVTKLDKKVTKLDKKEALSLIQKGIKFEKHEIDENQHYNNSKALNSDGKGTKSDKEERLSSIEKVTKLPSKKLQYFIYILLLSGTPISVDDLVDILSFNHRTFFNENYLKPLCSLGFVQRTNPDKPTSPNQKYLITEQGKRFLTAKD